jgi:hypothetical protein
MEQPLTLADVEALNPQFGSTTFDRELSAIRCCFCNGVMTLGGYSEKEFRRLVEVKEKKKPGWYQKEPVEQRMFGTELETQGFQLAYRQAIHYRCWGQLDEEETRALAALCKDSMPLPDLKQVVCSSPLDYDSREFLYTPPLCVRCDQIIEEERPGFRLTVKPKTYMHLQCYRELRDYKEKKGLLR